jgi:NAD(P)-dependent dehydrogenase (short-subunit alcohol dehydrogenase family)
MAAIENKVAIITGSGGGIGGAIALRYAREGAKLILADIDAGTAKNRAAEISSIGCEAFALVADVTDKKSVQQMVQATLDRWGRIDILVNVAGGADRKPVVEMTETDWDHTVDMNLKSVFLCSQAVLPTMLQQKYGKSSASLLSMALPVARRARAMRQPKRGLQCLPSLSLLRSSRTALTLTPSLPGGCPHRGYVAIIQTRSGQKRGRGFPPAVQQSRTRSPAVLFFSFWTRIVTSWVRRFM